MDTASFHFTLNSHSHCKEENLHRIQVLRLSNPLPSILLLLQRNNYQRVLCSSSLQGSLPVCSSWLNFWVFGLLAGQSDSLTTMAKEIRDLSSWTEIAPALLISPSKVTVFPVFGDNY